MTEQQDREQSEFNLAISWLNRINYWFWQANEAKFNNDSYAWLKSLAVVFDELITEMKPEEIQQQQNQLKSLYDQVNKELQKPRPTRTLSIPTTLYWQITDLERWLRVLMNKAGLQKKTKDDPRFAK